MIFSLRFTLLLFATMSSLAHSKPKLLATTPDLAWLAREVVGDKIEVDSLLDGTEDPHFVDALPSFISRAANADALCFMGLALESAWLPKVLSKSGNAKIQEGGKAHCDTSRYVKVLEKLDAPVDRSMGHVHAEGNPHYQLSPARMAEASRAILDTAMVLLPEHAGEFQGKQKKLASDLKGLGQELSTLLRALPENASFMEYHKDFVYFFDEFELKSVGAIEELPGLAPSVAYLLRQAEVAKRQRPILVLLAAHQPDQYVKKFAELSGVPYLRVKTGLRRGQGQDYRDFMKKLVTQILKVARPPQS